VQAIQVVEVVMELREYLRILVKRWWLIIPLTLISLATALLFSYSQTPIYESKATYVTRLGSSLAAATDDTNVADTVIYGMDTLTGGQRIFVTYCEIMTSQAVRAEAYKILNTDLSTVDLTKYKVFCANLPETNVLSVTVQGPSPELARRLNEAVGLAGTTHANSLYSYFPIENLDPVTISEDPVFPKHVQNGVLGGALGLIVGITLALMTEYLRSPLERLEAMSIRHAQLGIYNERYFRQRFEEETNRAHARLRPISVALLRLDPNEDFALLPESVRNTMLRSAALAMEDSLRQGDILAYLKPQTFGILLAETPGDEAQDILQKVHTELRARTFETNGYMSSFAANTGVVSSSGGALGYSATLEKASEALHLADDIGENSIHLVRATPRPFLTAEDSGPVAIDNRVAFAGATPFASNGLENVSWQASAETDWDTAPNGNRPAVDDQALDRPADQPPQG
jgi:diguanylate cyclase (GGDEF)-like protein